MNDEHYMKLVFELAKKGGAAVRPNPLVGAVVVKNGKIIGQGYHAYYGGPHAEPLAIRGCIEDPTGATLFCNLEPCCFTHPTKHNPPCTSAIIASGISKVILANLDPNPFVNGKGVEILQAQGIAVVTGVLEAEGEVLNQEFFQAMREKHKESPCSQE